MSVAAQVAAWYPRLGNKAGPFGPTTVGSGDSPNGAPVQVELYVGGTWVDITSYVMTRDGSGKISITRGQPDENAQPNPGHCAFQLNNRNGQFSPRNPLSPYYGQLGRNQPLRVSVQSGNSKSYRFWGEVVAWPQKWDTTGVDVWVDLEAAGILRRLGQGTPPSVSAMRGALSSGSVSPSTLVVAYWPFEDVAGSASMASGLPSGSPMTIIGTPSLASFSGFAGSASIVQTTAGSRFTGLIPAYTVTASTYIIFLAVVPVGGLVDGTVLCSTTASGTIKRWDLYYATAGGGGIGLKGYNASNSNVFSIAPINIVPLASTLNGALMQVGMQVQQSGPDILASVALTVLNNGATTLPVSDSSGSGTASGQTLGTLLSVSVSPNGDTTGTSFGHVRVESSPFTFLVQGDETQVLQGAAGENAHDRFRRLCGQNSIPHTLLASTADSVTMGPQPVGTFLDVINECATADGGIIFEMQTAVGLDYRTRESLENQSPVLVLSYTAFNLAEVPVPVDDDRYTRNDITVTRSGGSWARAQLQSGALSILAPPAGVGPYPDAKTVNIQSDSTLADQAGWRLHLGTADEQRYPQIGVNLAHASFVANPVLREQVLAVMPGDRITVTGPPSQLGPNEISQLVIGYTETIDNFQHRVSFNCTPERPYRIAVTDDVFFGRADTDGSYLAADAQPADTTLSVATVAGFPLWTTDPAEVPFDVQIGGERITVNGITGSTSPQLFAVTRSVNGVVKPQPANSDVRLYQPAIAALAEL